MNYNDIQSQFGTPLNQARTGSKGNYVGAFVFGAIVGGAITYFYLRSKMEQQFEIPRNRS